PLTASSRSLVALSSAGRRNSLTYTGLAWSRLIPSAISGERAHSIVGLAREHSDATVVPQEPAPSTLTCIPAWNHEPAARARASAADATGIPSVDGRAVRLR